MKQFIGFFNEDGRVIKIAYLDGNYLYGGFFKNNQPPKPLGRVIFKIEIIDGLPQVSIPNSYSNFVENIDKQKLLEYTFRYAVESHDRFTETEDVDGEDFFLR